MIKAVIPALLVAAMATGPALAGFHTGNSLLEQCKRGDQMYVLGYVVGVTDLMITFATTEKLCFPNQVTALQLKDVVCQFIDKHPERRHETADYLAFVALYETFPCNQ